MEITSHGSRASLHDHQSFAVLAGCLIGKDRTADNPSIKRPVLDFEVMVKTVDGPVFERISVILSDNALARALNGYHIGSIYLISGVLRVSEKEKDAEIYIDADSLTLLSEAEGDTKPDNPNIFRAKLLGSAYPPNFGIVVGNVRSVSGNVAIVTAPRKEITRGDLAGFDMFNILLGSRVKVFPERQPIAFSGQVCSRFFVADRAFSSLEEDE